MYNEIERYADIHDTDIESNMSEDLNVSSQDPDQDPVEQSNDDSGDGSTPASGSILTKDGENDEHVEPRLRCEFCNTDHDATELLEHAAYSDDDPHSSSGNVPQGFHPVTAPVIKDGTVQVAFPTKLRTNVEFHPVCRWCGEKFYLIDRCLDHIRSNQESVDADLHQANEQQDRTPILVPFNRDGTVIPTIPLLSELIADTALENIPGGDRIATSDTRADLNGSNPDPDSAGFLIEDGEKHRSGDRRNEAASLREDATECSKAKIANGSMNEDSNTADTTGTADERTVRVDSVLLALVDLVVKDDTTGYGSREDLLDTALDEFLGSIIVEKQTEFEHRTTTNRYLNVETDPALSHLLEKSVKSNDEFDSSEEFIQHALFAALDIDSNTSTITIPNYNRYAFVIEQLLQMDICPYESRNQIIRAALESYLEI